MPREVIGPTQMSWGLVDLAYHCDCALCHAVSHRFSDSWRRALSLPDPRRIGLASFLG